MKFISKDMYLNYGYDEKEDKLYSDVQALYNEYFNLNVKNSFSKAFLKKYYSYHGFHDWEVISLEQHSHTQGRLISRVIAELQKRDKIKKIVYNKVTCFKVDMTNEHFEKWGYDEFGIDEFLRIDEKTFSHEVYFPSGSSYYVEFQTIKIE